MGEGGVLLCLRPFNNHLLNCFNHDFDDKIWFSFILFSFFSRIFSKAPAQAHTVTFFKGTKAKERNAELLCFTLFHLVRGGSFSCFVFTHTHPLLNWYVFFPCILLDFINHGCMYVWYVRMCKTFQYLNRSSKRASGNKKMVKKN